MCTALKYKQTMGRNFDYEISYGEEIVQIPRHKYDNIYSIIGICTMYTDANGIYPLLYDGMNEYGLCMAGLAFVGNAYYIEADELTDWELGWKKKRGIKAYNIIMDILGQCKSVEEVKLLIANSVIIDKQIAPNMPNSDLHWFVCDKENCIIVEQTRDGLNWYDAETEVLTNNPIYPRQIATYTANKGLIGKFNASSDTRGNETDGLNGSYTSSGRFQRVSYLKEQLVSSNNDFDDISQTLHLLSSVEQVYGATPVNNKFEYTIYSIVYDMEHLCVYIKTYDDLGIQKEYLHLNDFDELLRWRI